MSKIKCNQPGGQCEFREVSSVTRMEGPTFDQRWRCTAKQRRSGRKLAFLSNTTAGVLDAGIYNSGITRIGGTMSAYFDRATIAYGWIVSKLGSWAAIPLRLIVGYGFMEHGYAKIVKGPEHLVGILHAIGVPAPELMAWATILVELVGGFAVLLGAFVPWVSVPMAAVFLV